MEITIQKYGGTSLATDEQVHTIADRAASAHGRGRSLVVVVSARGGTTDELIEAAGALTADPCPGETDKLLATGEVAAAAMMAISLQGRGVPAVSLTGPQAGLRAAGRHGAGVVTEIDPAPVRDWLERDHVVVVAGFQALTPAGDVITLGRGGSDTSAVALAAAHDARACEVYTDVDGVHRADPRVVEGAPILPRVEARVMAEMAVSGARVMHARAVELAATYGLDVGIGNAAGGGTATTIVGRREPMHEAGPPPTTLGERPRVVAITHETAVVQTIVRAGARLTGPAVLDALADGQISVDAVASWPSTAEDLHLAFCAPASQLPAVRDVLGPLLEQHGGAVEAREPCGRVSIVGTGLLSRPGLTAGAIAELARYGIPADCVSCTSTRTSLLVPVERVRDAVVILYGLFELDREPVLAPA
ncbi:aspartate kinase [Spirillospora sp. NPDC047279]|uniref:aspartate kinase n=1 Tax=Spirillospora sp. NPDC047279 TaxID=3155478 RepID=UPI0033F7A52F